MSILGGLWKLYYLKSIQNPGSGYEYAGKFARDEIPNIGYYKGMAITHANYMFEMPNKLLNFITLSNPQIQLFLNTFLILIFVYLIAIQFRNKKIAYLSVALMSLGPIELFYLTTNLNHGMAYVGLFILFLFFKSKEKNIFWLALLFSAYLMTTYYTSTIIQILASGGFIIAIILKEFLDNKNLNQTLINIIKNKKIKGFLIIILILSSYLFLYTSMGKTTINVSTDASILKSSINLKIINITENTTQKNYEFNLYPGLNPYKDPKFLGLSAIRWQSVFFILCGVSFIGYLIIKKDFSKENLFLLYCIIPISLISFGFLYAGYPSRIFNYFAFFGILVLKIPKKFFKKFFVISLIFIIITTMFIAHDKKIFFENSEGEIETAKWIKNNLNGKIFSDQKFINLIIQEDYYNVTGDSDKSIIIKKLFYINNKTSFQNTISWLNNSNVKYIAITKRMEKKYILMVDFPQKPLTNIQFYEKNLNKIYDNGDVRIYTTNLAIKK
ncbi:hypothetical protein HOD75_00565 [archaeon]|nr:hypothetical protein [archaeon]MBT4241368.1 hypothetical protein [archaeon]MBT4418189.1 hypothetical protein [archaeon]